MRIISNFKEPYDRYLAQDPKVVYHRVEKDLGGFSFIDREIVASAEMKVTDSFQAEAFEFIRTLKLCLSYAKYAFDKQNKPDSICKFYMVANKLFFQVTWYLRQAAKESFFGESVVESFLFELTPNGFVSDNAEFDAFMNKSKSYQNFRIKDGYSLLSKVGRKFQLTFGVPVLQFSMTTFSMRVTANPQLGKIRLFSILPLEVAFQEISMLVAEIQNKCEPPIKISDKDRLLQHGFDSKQSFRHRVADC